MTDPVAPAAPPAAPPVGPPVGHPDTLPAVAVRQLKIPMGDVTWLVGQVLGAMLLWGLVISFVLGFVYALIPS